MSILKPDFTKEGPGVGKNIAADPGFIRFFKTIWNKFGQLVILNMVYIFACLPLVTIGPATAALTYVMRNFSQGKPVFFMSDFMEKAKSSFKQAFFVTLIDAAVATLVFFSFIFWSDPAVPIPSFFRPLALVVTFIVAYLTVCMNIHIFPMMVSFDLPLKKLIKNSVILAMYKLWHNLAVLVFDISIFVLCIIFLPLTFPVLLCLTFSIICLFNSFITYPLLIKYVAKPTENEQKDDSDRVFRD